jgi:epoxyqueuosine reductase
VIRSVGAGDENADSAGATIDQTTDAQPLEARIKARAYGLGFDLVGVTSLGAARSAPRFDEWLDAGFAGDMGYLHRGAEARRDTRRPFAGVRSAIVVAMDYGGREPGGPVARYARGDDYHDVMVGRLRDLHDDIRALVGHDVRGKAYVDTGPILERDLARQAGLGWFGKNTMLINPRRGSFFFLGSLLIDLDLVPDSPFDEMRCGRCTRCIDSCPTNALVEPGVLDSQRCISYLTIELRGEIPADLREPMGGLIYGCDICQDVCPWNVKFATALAADSPYGARDAIGGKDPRTLAREILEMTQEEFSRAFKGSPMKRAKLRGLHRNAAVVLGNVGTADDLDVLTRALDDQEPFVREHAAWALERVERRSR